MLVFAGVTLDSPTVSLLITAGLFALLQIWWIGSLLRRNQRNSLAAPMSSKAFRSQLERIFRDSP